MSTPERRLSPAEILQRRVGAVLREALTSSGKSQKDLAVGLGLSRARISQILNGRENLTMETIERILNQLNRDVQLVVKKIPNDTSKE